MIRAYVDSLQGVNARVLVGEEAVAVSVPVHELPPGTKEGTVLRLNLAIDHAATASRARAKAQGLE